MSNKEERVRLAREITKLGKQLMMLGTWDGKKISEINQKIAELDAQRKALFTEGEEEAMKQRLKETATFTWSGCYTDWMGWGSGVPAGGWPESWNV